MNGNAADCDFGGSFNLGSSPADYTIPDDTPQGTTLNFGCSKGSHCNAGMWMSVVIGGNSTGGCTNCDEILTEQKNHIRNHAAMMISSW